ncbi:MAG: ferric reductase-like transmembrane domain-containing protein [Candidatus Izemoplasmatales bacterium]|nr:ferric reductase-like transmembrane domain-containing protein [Candidatus Izemoplasmatales bacterium]
MITIPFVGLLFFLAMKAKFLFQKYSIVLYIVFFLLSVAGFYWIELPVFTFMKQGYLGLALFYVVMLVGALPRKQPTNQPNPVRRDYSILGFLAITPHAIYYLQKAMTGEISQPIFGIIAYLIMIPLFVISFRWIRRLMNETVWKKIQKAAYISYLLLFIHLIINSDGVNRIAYVVLFGFYFLLKTRWIMKLFQK